MDCSNSIYKFAQDNIVRAAINISWFRVWVLLVWSIHYYLLDLCCWYFFLRTLLLLCWKAAMWPVRWNVYGFCQLQFRKGDENDRDDNSEIRMSTYHYEDGTTDIEKPQDLLVKLAEYEPSLPRLDAKSVSQYKNRIYMYDDERYYWLLITWHTTSCSFSLSWPFWFC